MRWIYFLLPLVMGALLMQRLGAAELSRPNIVFFLVDDLGYADCGFNGGTTIRTPRIDQLAHEGANLKAEYVQPVCSPTRAALMTGRYPTHTGVYSIIRPGAVWGLPLEERTLGNALQDAGYTTAICGKWHLGEFEPAYRPTARGFQHQYGPWLGMIGSFTHERNGVSDWHRDDKDVQEEGYSTHLLAREACRLIAAQPKTKPLFLYFPFNAVHSPHKVPESYSSAYPNLSAKTAKYAGMVSAVDEAIGQVVDALAAAGLRDNTLIIFSSDNGGAQESNNGPLKGGKHELDEGGIRACAFANWPGHIPGGQQITEPIHIIDWYPTLVKLAGGTLQQAKPIDGLDIWPTLTRKAPSPHDAILCATTKGAALIMEGWKLIREIPTAKGGDKTPKPSLYHIAMDLGETKDLVDQEPKRLAALNAKWETLMAGMVPSCETSPSDKRKGAKGVDLGEE